MVTQEQHRMERVGAHVSGAEEWACATCGRRLVLHAQPTLSAAMLTQGDARAVHYGGLSSATPQPHLAEAGHVSGGVGGDGDMPLEMLRPWLKALRAIEDEGLAL
jgi:hypothetical protein